MKRSLYLDNNGTTFLDPSIRVFLKNALEEEWGNPSAVLRHGKKARLLLQEAREILASYLHKQPKEITFTSGGTEGINTLLEHFFKEKKGHFITSDLEHPAVLEKAKALEKEGVEVTYLHPGQKGFVSLEELEKAIKPHTKLVALMAANNETGILTPWEEIASFLHGKKIPFFVDAVQLLGKSSFSIPEGVTAMAFSGHKIHGLQGSGFMYIKSHTPITPLLLGGGQERGFRGGTENMLGIVSLGKAVALLKEQEATFLPEMEKLRDFFEKSLLEKFPFIEIHGMHEKRLCNTSNVCFTGKEGDALLFQLDEKGVEASLGSACAAGSLEPSRVLLNMDIPREKVKSSLRFSLSRFTTKEDLQQVLAILGDIFLF